MNLFFALSAQGETTFFEDLWLYLYNSYLAVDQNYENLGFDKSPLFSLRLTVLGIFVGAVIACLVMVYNRRVLGDAVRKVIASDALSPENAKTLKELGFAQKILFRNAFRSSVSLRRVVKCVAEEEFYREQAQKEQEYEQRRANGEKLPKFKPQTYMIDPDNDRFYIPEDLRIRAEIRFEKKGSGWMSGIISVFVLCIAFFIVLLVLPVVFNTLGEYLGTFK